MIETTGNWALKSITFASAVAYFDSGMLTANKDMVRRRHKIVHVDKRNFRVYRSKVLAGHLVWNTPVKFSSAFAEIYVCSFLTNFSLKLLSSLFSSVDGFFGLFG